MEAVDRIITELRPLAEKLGEGAEAMWGILIKQAIIRGSLVAALAVLFLVGAVISAKIAADTYKRGQTKQERNEAAVQRQLDANRGVSSRYSGYAGYSKPHDFDSTDYDSAFGTYVGISVSFVIFASFAAFYAAPRLLNPGYYAINEILRTLGG